VTRSDGAGEDEDEQQLARWFLSPDERGNPATAIDRRRGSRAWSTGNDVRMLIDGREYFAKLLEELLPLGSSDWVYLTDLEGNGDERLDDSGTEIGAVLAQAARRGVRVRGLLWRSHPAGANAGQVENLRLSRTVNDAGGELVLDHRVRRGGSHHQKLVVIRHDASETRDVAFVGGIDLAHGRRDDSRHAGDEQPAELGDEHYGERPPWHDAQLEIVGPAVDDVAFTFRERWEDPTPLDTSNPWRALLRRVTRTPVARGPLQPLDAVSSSTGPHAVQVLRTYPAKRKPYPFAPNGERSIARAYVKAFGRARRLVYVEDQYLWSLDAMRVLCEALQREPDLRCVIVIPRYPDPDGRVLGAASRFGRERLERALARAGGDRVAIFDLENHAGTPIYVHAKTCVVDDLWMVVGSDNLNRRSWTHDSELCCAVVDGTRDDREPLDPTGRSEGARRLARETRLRLAREHLGAPGTSDDHLLDPVRWFETLRDSARALDEWHAAGARGARPPGHLRRHPPDRISRAARPFLHFVHAWLLDPDGRPRGMRRPGVY
jgi:phosphatidylserine/phosphatidylglycerophosphate/cardiolipin synthase-like enzyme